MNVNRREFLGWAARAVVALGLLRSPESIARAASGPGLPTRPLGKTGHQVTTLALGGEGVLRTTGRMKEAVPVIRRALEIGINYFDTAPAYSQSQDYLGEGLGADRQRIFLASKTHDRSMDGSLRLLEDSLRRLRTDHLDLWQLHNLTYEWELDAIFARDGAIRAMEKAKAQKLVRFLGITGHASPAVLAAAAKRFPFDTVLVAVNAADRMHGSSFITEFLPLANRQGLGVIAMKVMARGSALEDPVRLSPEEAIGYVLSQPVSTALIGCSSPAEVDQNAAAAAAFRPWTPEQIASIEARVKPWGPQLTYFKV